jgi:hypothetical protein
MPSIHGRCVAIVAACLFAAAGCTVHAAADPTEVRVPLPPQSVDIAAVDNDRVATLVDRGGRKSVSVIRRDSGEVVSHFDISADAAGLAEGEAGQLIVVASSTRWSTLTVYTVGGEQTGSMAIDGIAEKVAGTKANRVYVLVKNGLQRFVEEVELGRLEVKRKIAAPAAAASLAARLDGPEPTLLVSEPDGSLYERAAGGTVWQRLSATGVDPVYADSGNAIYALQRYDKGTFVSVIARPFGLPVRLFPVANTAARLSDGPDRALFILERTASSASARTLTCRSPLVAVQPYNEKRQRYADVGGGKAPAALSYRSVGGEQDPAPLPTGDQC